MRVKFLFAAALALSFSVSASAYNSCTNAAGQKRWTDDACAPGETQVAFGKDGQPVQDTREPWVGMSEDEAMQLASPWGPPTKVNTTVTKRGTRKQWVYSVGWYRAYLYFDNGVLTSIQK